MSGYLRLSDGKVVPVADGLVVGRVAGCDVVLDDTKASRRHARVVVESGVVEIEDLDSSNGTLLNGKPVTRRVLRDGDVVRIGTTELVYHAGAVPGAGAPPAAAVFGDDDDLFADAPAPAAGAAAPPATRPTAEPAPPPPARAPAPPRPEATPAPAAPPPADRPLPPPAAPDVVEFADEVVQIRRAPEPARSKPAAAAAEPEIRSHSRILQYQKTAGGGGLLGDDLAQMGGGARSLIFAGVLLVAAAIVYGVIQLVR